MIQSDLDSIRNNGVGRPADPSMIRQETTGAVFDKRMAKFKGGWQVNAKAVGRRPDATPLMLVAKALPAHCYIGDSRTCIELHNRRIILKIMEV